MENENPTPHKESGNTVKIFGNETKIRLDSNVKKHINKSIKGMTERTAIKYIALVFSWSALFLLGIIFNSIWGLNERSSRNEGRLMEFSSYIEMLKFQNKALESENTFLKKQRTCLIEKKKTTTKECFYDNENR